MPYTPYHFGPSGLVGIVLRRWIDIPVFILANVAVDSEVLIDNWYSPGWPVHQTLHLHTLLVGGLMGVVFGAGMYYVPLLRRLSERAMGFFGLPYRISAGRMIMAGILGVIFHVLIDSVHHQDVQLFWPFRTDNPVWRYWAGGNFANVERLREVVVGGCLICWATLAVWYGAVVDMFRIRRQKLTDVRRNRRRTFEGV